MYQYRVTLSELAKKDVGNIYRYICDIASEQVARVVIARMADKVATFTTFPERNEVFATSKNGLLLRATMSGKYRIIYTVKRREREVLVARIISAKRDIGALALGDV